MEIKEIAVEMVPACVTEYILVAFVKNKRGGYGKKQFAVYGPYESLELTHSRAELLMNGKSRDLRDLDGEPVEIIGGLRIVKLSESTQTPTEIVLNPDKGEVQ